VSGELTDELQPAGVGFGQSPPAFLQPGDEVEIRVTGLGSLRNKVAETRTSNSTLDRLRKTSSVPVANTAKSVNGINLTEINKKPLYYQTRGSGPPIVFVHGLGGSSEHYTPLISSLSLDKSHTIHQFDLEGHGLSPTSALSSLSIESFAADVKGVFDHAGLSSTPGTTLVAHSMGCAIAVQFVLQNPGLVKNLILLGPVPNPLPEAASNASIARAALARGKGMAAVVDAVSTAATSEATKRNNPVGMAAIRLSLLSQDPEGYAKACQALAGATSALPLERVDSQTLVITGDEDKVCPPAVANEYASTIPHSRKAIVLKGVGHWHIFEDIQGVSDAVKTLLT
jgi:pimeloyl-ACP methyl ester carboxylesterase